MEVSLELPIHLAVLEFAGVRADDAAAAYEGLAVCAERYRREAAARGTSAPGAIDGIGHARALFHALGIDATRRRPSSEALLNRALKDKPLPKVNSLVDVGNWCSLDFLLPLGVYDRDRIRGAIVLRQGVEGESYEGVGNRPVNLAGRFLLADDEGPFGSPITDSRRSSVTEQTTNAVVLIYAPAAYDPGDLEAHAQVFARRVETCCGGTTSGIAILAG